MDQISELKRDVSPGLLDDLSKELLPGETVLVSLPGSFGEALVVSRTRAFVVRERASTLVPMSDVFAFPLSQVSGAMVISSGAGGYIELRLAEPVSDPDMARVYFPSSEESRFRAAAEYLSKPAPVEQLTSVPASIASDLSASGMCPKCGCGIGDDAVFLPAVWSSVADDLPFVRGVDPG